MGNFMLGFETWFSISNIIFVFIGVIVGIIFGAIPGLTATMAVALFLPATFVLDTVTSLTLLCALYIGGISGGLVSAILLNIPGTPASLATTFDGAPMAKQGRGIEALGLGVVFSFLGTAVSLLALFFISPALAKVAINFTNYEYFAVTLFALSFISVLADESMVKGLLSGMLGMMLATVGGAPMDGLPRFTFGFTELLGGFDLLPLLIGLFAITELLKYAKESHLESEIEKINISFKDIKGFGFSMKVFLSQIVNALRSAFIGIGIGILPAMGGGISNLLSYSIAKKQSKYPEKFGTGIPDGIVASETANNACVGGAMIPLLTLGIPGDSVTAILLGAFMVNGIIPGPMLFVTNVDLVYSIFIALAVANLMMLFTEFFGLRIFCKLLDVPRYIILPIIIPICVVGAFGLTNRMFHVWAALFTGLIGYIILKLKFPIAPLLLGFILCETTELNLRRALQLSRGRILPFLQRPITCIFIVLAVTVIIMPIINSILKIKEIKKVV